MLHTFPIWPQPQVKLSKDDQWTPFPNDPNLNIDGSSWLVALQLGNFFHTFTSLTSSTCTTHPLCQMVYFLSECRGLLYPCRLYNFVASNYTQISVYVNWICGTTFVVKFSQHGSIVIASLFTCCYYILAMAILLVQIFCITFLCKSLGFVPPFESLKHQNPNVIVTLFFWNTWGALPHG